MGIKDIIKPISAQSFIVGMGVAAFAYFIGPQLKQALRPAAVKGAQGVMTLGSKTVKAFEESRDKLSHMMQDRAEAANNKVIHNQENANLQFSLLKELKEDRDTSNKILQELSSSISNLKDEILQMRNNSNYQQN
jgi:hypothetical protein